MSYCPEHHDGYQALLHTVNDTTGSCRLVVERVDPKMDSLIYAKVSLRCCDCCSMIVFSWNTKYVDHMLLMHASLKQGRSR